MMIMMTERITDGYFLNIFLHQQSTINLKSLSNEFQIDWE